VFVQYANGTFLDGSSAVGTLVGSTSVDPATGAWAIDFTLAGANDPRTPTSGLFAVRPTTVIAITTLGGTSPVSAINLR
jgi:hypothetical protein